GIGAESYFSTEPEWGDSSRRKPGRDRGGIARIMRVNINLASRKFEDVQRFYVVRSTSLAILAVLAVGLLVMAYLKFTRDRQAEAQVRDLQQKIAVLERQRNELSAADRLPENREVTQQKQYWNTQIMKRAFSWTTLFNELQKIMPSRAYLNTVQPE